MMFIRFSRVRSSFEQVLGLLPKGHVFDGELSSSMTWV
jgi:hypothetical protein